jgi:hypothetical protein
VQKQKFVRCGFEPLDWWLRTTQEGHGPQRELQLPPWSCTSVETSTLDHGLRKAIACSSGISVADANYFWRLLGPEEQAAQERSWCRHKSTMRPESKHVQSDLLPASFAFHPTEPHYQKLWLRAYDLPHADAVTCSI